MNAPPRRVVVTGGTGTLGQAVLPRLLATCERVVVLSRDEYKQAQMAERWGGHPALRFFLGDVRNQARLELAFHGCDTVIHCAALKRVDAVADDPEEAIATNVLGSMAVIRAAMTAGVGRVLLISSDKAVEPSTFYGQTKALMEAYAIRANRYTMPRGTAVACARWGNVLNSRGAVYHRWRACLIAGAPLPLTDARMTRFLLTLEQAAGWVLRMLDVMRGGEVLIPLLPAAALTDLAEALAPGHPHTAIGRRPGGEKLAEVLIDPQTVPHVRRIASDLLCLVPETHGWCETAPWGGVPVAPDFTYRSDTSYPRLGVAGLRDLLKGLA